MKWFKKMMIGLSIFGLVAGLSACGHSTPEEKQARMVKKVSHKLDLTDEQKPYAERFFSTLTETRQQMQVQRQTQLPKLRSLVLAETLDKSEINAMIDAQAQILQNNRDNILDSLVAFHGVLNHEQKQELDEMLGKFQKYFDER